MMRDEHFIKNERKQRQMDFNRKRINYGNVMMSR